MTTSSSTDYFKRIPIDCINNSGDNQSTSERMFQLAQRQTRITTECLAGVTTFFAMVYVAAVNPLILSAAGLDVQAVFVATCLTIALGSILFGCYVNFPVALAPAMGVNVYFTYHIVLGLGVTWQAALGMVFMASLALLGLSFTRLRQWLMDAIPISLQLAISVGIGLFIIIIGLQNSGIITPSRLALMEQIEWYPVGCFVGGLIFIGWLRWWRVPGALLWTILLITLVSGGLGKTTWHGLWAWPIGLSATALQLEVWTGFHLDVLFAIFALFMIMLFDTTGTLMSLVRQVHRPDQHPAPGFYKKALRSESIATLTGALLGTSPTAPYVESVAGIQTGGRSGLTAVVVGLLFLGLLFFAPLIRLIPTYAIAPVLVFVGWSLIKEGMRIHWRDAPLALGALATVVIMPLTFSIADGMGAGFIVYTAINVLMGRWRQLHPMMMGLASVFGLFFLLQII